MSRQSKVVAEGNKLRDVSSLDVKMADRWLAAGRKSQDLQMFWVCLTEGFMTAFFLSVLTVPASV